MLTRREVILTQLCTIEVWQGRGAIHHAMKQLPVILRALGMEVVTEQEIVNMMIELESSRTEIALRIFTALGK